MNWIKSSYCSWENCVETATDGQEILVRNSKDPDGPQLRFTLEEWKAFTLGVRDGEFD